MSKASEAEEAKARAEERLQIYPRYDFETIRDSFNRWRSENAAVLTRDEAIRFALGEWLEERGYLVRSTLDAPSPARSRRSPRSPG